LQLCIYLFYLVILLPSACIFIELQILFVVVMVLCFIAGINAPCAETRSFVCNASDLASVSACQDCCLPDNSQKFREVRLQTGNFTCQSLPLGSGAYLFQRGSRASIACASSDESIHIACPTSLVISHIDFASFGRPEGQCGFYTFHQCHSANSRAVLGEHSKHHLSLWRKRPHFI
jgi:hypothetical protein